MFYIICKHIMNILGSEWVRLWLLWWTPWEPRSQQVGRRWRQSLGGSPGRRPTGLRPMLGTSVYGCSSPKKIDGKWMVTYVCSWVSKPQMDGKPMATEFSGHRGIKKWSFWMGKPSRYHQGCPSLDQPFWATKITKDFWDFNGKRRNIINLPGIVITLH